MNNKNILTEGRIAIPTIGAMKSVAFSQIDKIIDDLHRAISNPSKNKAIFKKIYPNKFYDTSYRIKIMGGAVIPIYAYGVGADRFSRSKNSARGAVGVKKPHFFSGPRIAITLTLYCDPNLEEVLWVSSYEETLIHEVTHIVQALDTVFRIASQKGIELDGKTIEDILTRIYTRKGSGTAEKLKSVGDGNIAGKIEARIDYHYKPAELGANANSLINYLYKKAGTEAIEDIVSCVDTGRPTFRDIDNAIRDIDRRGITVWGTYDKLIDLEMKYKNLSREEWTEGYKLKKTLLKVASEFYKRHYK